MHKNTVPGSNLRSVFLDEKPTLDITTARKSITELQNFRSNGSISNGLPPPAVDGHIPFPQDIIYENAKPINIVLQFMGALPISKPRPGESEYRLSSLTMFYSFVVLAALLTYVVFVVIKRIAIVRNLEGRFEEAVIAYLFLVNLLPVVIVPMMWYESRKVVKVWNHWSDFELLYFQVSKRPLAINLKMKALVIAIVLPLLASLSVVVTHVTMVHFRISQVCRIITHALPVIPYCFLDTLTYMMGAYWYLSCETLSAAANVLADDFQRALRNIGPAAMVAEYRSLWLRLSKLARDTGTATCYTFTFINLYLFLIITLSIYGLMSQLSEGFGVKDIGLAVTAFSSIGLLFFICDEAHYASHNVRTNFQKKLLMVELNWMNIDAQTEINMFLRATEMNPANINLGGFFDVNRNLFKSLLTTMVTYLVVLLQFQISIPDDTVTQTTTEFSPTESSN
ncbi:gustatory and odorant receptor 24 [Phlebotomus argentipes]|uniref:gustatory and odorant receptor 24 n=1 Tax=Phlebotomus argentipes TaxID=94469 RepID=UPI00289350E3|nr:gustatory and odorant receptor 24 [Phlebotomus argentipes]